MEARTAHVLADFRTPGITHIAQSNHLHMYFCIAKRGAFVLGSSLAFLTDISLPYHEAIVTGGFLSRSSQVVVVGSMGSLAVFDLLPLNLKSVSKMELHGTISCISISPNDVYAAVNNGHRAVVVAPSAPERKVFEMISSAGAEIRSVLFLSCDIVVAGDADGFLFVGSLTSGFVTSFKSHVPSVRALAANERSTLFAVSGGAHLSLWDSLRLTCIQVVPWPNVVLGTAFSSVLNCILVSIDSKGVAAISLDDYSERVLTVPLGNVLGFCAGMSGSSHACVSSML